MGLFFHGAYSLDDTDIKVKMTPLSGDPSNRQGEIVWMIKASHHEIEKEGESSE